MSKVKKEIKLTGNTLENIKIMAPYLSERQQYIVFGMMLAQIGEQGNNKDVGGR